MVSKKKFALVVGTAVFVVAFLAFAGVALADSYTVGDYTSGLHSNVVDSDHNVNVENVCEACHVPHFADSAAFLWANPPNNQTGVQGDSTSIIRGLCYSCHDGTETGYGADTVFDVTKWSHPTTDVVTRGSAGRDCDLCHDPHENSYLVTPQGKTNERPNFIRYDRIGSSTNIVYLGPNVWVSCHGGNIEGGGSSHSPGGGVAEHNHPIDFTGTVTNSGGSTQVDYVVTKGGADPPIADEPVQYDASIDQWGVRLFDTTNYPKVPHPTLADSGTVNCESCHAPHGAENETLNTDMITDGTLCTDCHE